jgi:hypothetical protein
MPSRESSLSSPVQARGTPFRASWKESAGTRRGQRAHSLFNYRDSLHTLRPRRRATTSSTRGRLNCAFTTIERRAGAQRSARGAGSKPGQTGADCARRRVTHAQPGGAGGAHLRAHAAVQEAYMPDLQRGGGGEQELAVAAHLDRVRREGDVVERTRNVVTLQGAGALGMLSIKGAGCQ